MTPITRQDILAHQVVVPWGAQYQVEQDLLLCRSMVALFDDRFLSSQVAMRGGTLLHKVHLAPPVTTLPIPGLPHREKGGHPGCNATLRKPVMGVKG